MLVEESGKIPESQLVVNGHLLLLCLFAGDSVGGHGGELAHAAFGAFDRLGDPAAGAFHGTVFGLAVQGTAHCIPGGFDLLSDGGCGG
jgi:hypothetical protein